MLISIVTITYLYMIIINPRHLHEGYSNRSMCVSVSYHANYYVHVPRIYVENKVPLDSLSNIFCMWLSLKTQKFWHNLLTTIAFLSSLMSSRWTKNDFFST